MEAELAALQQQRNTLFQNWQARGSGSRIWVQEQGLAAVEGCEHLSASEGRARASRPDG